MTFDENVLYNDKKNKGSTTMKQVGVDVELRKTSSSDVVADTKETSETVADEPKVKQVTPKQELRRSSRTRDVYGPGWVGLKDFFDPTQSSIFGLDLGWSKKLICMT